MKNTTISLMVLAVAALLTLISFIAVEEPVKSVSVPKADGMVADWERAKAYTLEYLSAADHDVIAFRPTEEMRTFGQQMLHLAESNYGFASAASGEQSPVAFGQLEKSFGRYQSKDSLTSIVMRSYDFAIAALKKVDESKMEEIVKIFKRFEMSRKDAFLKGFEHQTHHRGQTTVYLRLKGIKPPNEKLF